jgi:thioredoxin reductase (NADPH)
MSVIDTRREQMFPVLSDADIARLKRFGEPRRYAKGTLAVRAGEKTEGLLVILSGKISMAPHHHPDAPIVVHGPGEFQGELAQLSGRPSLVDGRVLEDIDGILIPPNRIRDLMVQEADLGERIMRALILRRVGLLEQRVGGPIIIGHSGHRDVLRLAVFLSRNGHPFETLDPATDETAKPLVEQFHLQEADLPTVLCPNGSLLRNPSERQLALCIGLLHTVDPDLVHDVAIVGSGPAGMAAAVYAASEGLSVIVLDCRAFGGQAGASARIENYLGFPTGISGMALMARAYNQAQKFGADFIIPAEVASLAKDESARCFHITLTSGERLRARAVVIASGAEYRRLDIPNLAEYEGAHVHYWASPLESRLCTGREVALVGGGNSAGQAAVFLSGLTKTVWMIVRGASLEATMSKYLCERIAAQPNIEVLVETEVTRLEGKDGTLERVAWRNRKTREETCRDISHLFLMIGAAPNTRWLAQSGIGLDPKGFVLTGDGDKGAFESNLSGVFAIGDVRAASVKRVAASVGEGAGVVAAIHGWLGSR